MIVPEAGCQCLSYRAGTLDVIAGPANPDAWREHPHRGGIPILFPWPGRIAGARFTFKGREYRLPVNEPARGHSIHGFACERAFRVTRRGPYFVTAILDSSDYSDLSSIWPWPFVLEIDYEVGNGLRLKARITNTGDSVMPFGFGAHPYFHAPLNPKGTRDAMLIQLDADARWPLDARLIPTGATEPLAGKYDLRAPRPLGADTYDDVFRMAPIFKMTIRSAPRARLIDPSLKDRGRGSRRRRVRRLRRLCSAEQSRRRARAVHLRARRLQSRGPRRRGRDARAGARPDLRGRLRDSPQRPLKRGSRRCARADAPSRKSSVTSSELCASTSSSWNVILSRP